MIQCPKTMYADGEERIDYDDPSFPLYLREGFISHFAGRRVSAHFHEDFEYILLLKGELAYDVNGKQYHLTEGGGIFVNSNALHFGFGVGEEECHFVCLLFSPMLLASSQSVEETLIAPFLKGDDAFLLPPHCEAAGILTSLWKEKNEGTRNPLLYQSLLFRLWNATLPYFHPVRNEPVSPSLKTIKEALAFIKGHFAEKISLGSIAKALAISPSLLSKLFQRYLYQSPIAYLDSYRLSKASSLLKESNQPIKDIADQTGYDSANFFSRAFRKKYGMSPKQFRKQFASKKDTDLSVSPSRLAVSAGGEGF